MCRRAAAAHGCSPELIMSPNEVAPDISSSRLRLRSLSRSLSGLAVCQRGIRLLPEGAMTE